jgi:hypothetical protein
MNETSFGYLMANNGDLIRTKVLGLAAALMLINFLWALGRTFLVSSDLTTDYTPVIRAIILTIVLTLYSDLLSIATGMIDYVASLFSPKDPQEVLASLKAMTAKVDGAFTTANSNLWKDFDLKWDTDQMKKDIDIVLGVMSNSMEMVILKLVRLVAEGLTLLVRAFVAKMQVLVVVFLAITGPIAILISMIPGFQGAMAYWFRNLLHAKFWAMTIGVLDNIVNFYVDNLVDSHIDNMMNNATLEQRFGAIFNLVVVHYCVMGAYLATPFLTNTFIGGITSAGGLAGWAANKGANLPGEATRTGQAMSRNSSSGNTSRSATNNTSKTTAEKAAKNTTRAEKEESYEARVGRQAEPEPNYDAPALSEGQRRPDDDRYDDYSFV